MQKNEESEWKLNEYEDQKQFSNMMFFVWDGNHRLLAWTNVINKIYEDDLSMHVCLDAWVLHLKGNEIVMSHTMAKINR